MGLLVSNVTCTGFGTRHVFLSLAFGQQCYKQISRGLSETGKFKNNLKYQKKNVYYLGGTYFITEKNTYQRKYRI